MEADVMCGTQLLSLFSVGPIIPLDGTPALMSYLASREDRLPHRLKPLPQHRYRAPHAPPRPLTLRKRV